MGYKPLPNGDIPVFKERVRHAIRVYDSGKFDYFIMSGGETRPGMVEAEIARSYIQGELGRPDISPIMETKSKTTADSFVCLKGMRLPVSQMVIVTSWVRSFRVALLVRKLWPEMKGKISFSTVGGNTVGEVLTESILYVLTIFDPREKFFLPLLVKMFRNG